jgi:hypothetical protein
MATTELDRQLELWEWSGLVTADQVAAIRAFERRAGRIPAAAGAPVGRPSSIEALAYLGSIVTVIGILTLVYTSQASLEWIAALTFVLGIAAMVAARTFARRASPPSMRAAGACAGVAAIATGVAAGELAAAISLLTRTMVLHSPCNNGLCGPESVTTTSHAGNVLVGACAGLLVGLVPIRRVPGQTSALVTIASAYTAAGAIVSLAGLEAANSAGSIALLLVAASALLAGLGEVQRRRRPAVHALFGFAAVVGATVPLFVLGGGSNARLDVIGALVAAASLALGVAARRPGVAYGGVVGLAGLVVDVGTRTFVTATARGIFFVVTGAGCVALLIALSHVLRASHRTLPTPAE